MSPVPAAAPQPHVRITISDPFVRTVLGPCLIGIFGLFLAGVLAIDYVLADVSPVGFSWLGLFDGLPSPFSSATVRFFEAIGSVPDVIKLPVGNLLPALVAAICFQASGISLTIVGRTLFLISVGLIAFSAAAVIPSWTPFSTSSI